MIRPPGLTTVFTDASFCPTTKAAGWGGWAKTELLGAHESGGRLTGCHSPNDAELMAIARFTWELSQLDFLTDAVMIQSDSIRALGLLMGSDMDDRFVWSPTKIGPGRSQTRPPGSHTGMSGMENTACLFIRKNLVGVRRVLLRHVKGHSGVGDRRSWVNRRCDRVARRHINQQRETSGVLRDR